MPLCRLVRFALAALLVLVVGTACSPGEPVRSEGPHAHPTTACATDADCGGSTPVCDPLRGCVVCQFDAQCADGERCVDRVCGAFVRCSEDADCAGTDTPACDLQSGICEACLLDADCGGSARCIRKQCESATACTNSLDCGTNEVCDRGIGWCVECASDADCDEGSTCVGNACVARCSSDKDCVAADLLCDPSAGHCVECVAHADCPGTYHCAAGVCEVDVCQSGAGRCDGVQNAALQCNEQGSDFIPVLCPTGSSCAEKEGAASCTPWTCEPLSASCSDNGSTLRVCAQNGLGFSEEVDCTEDGGTCQGASCVDVVCEPNALTCTGSTVTQCNVKGTSFTVTQTCSVNQHCDAGSATCQPDVCSQGLTVCEGNVARKCNADGSGFESGGTDCAALGQACYLGQCLPQICTPGDRHCFAGSVYSCLDNGTRRLLYSTCYSTYYCDDSVEMAVCRPRVCTPGQPYCNGEVAGTCDALGAGPLAGSTTDCAALSGQACSLGVCLPKVCSGTYGCSQGNPRTCIANGTAFGTLQDTCQTTEHCVDNARYCATDVCTQGAPACNGNIATTCNADGSGYLAGGTDCGDNQRCVSGTCLPVICTANTYFCDGGNVYRCGSDGTTSSLFSACSAAQYCQEGLSYCLADVCTGGQPSCNGELVSTCKADGSGPEDGGTACPSGQTCANGACAPIVCDPNAYFCLDDNVERCNALGTAWSRYWTCTTAQFCDVSGTTPLCRENVCNATQAACDGEAIAVCDASGGGYASSGTDCAATDQVCNLSACVDQDVVVVGAGATGTAQASSYAYFNLYSVTSSRSLTQIEQQLSVSGTSQFTWYVYEHTSATGYFTKIFEKLTTSAGVAAYHSSGVIDVPLVAGRYYLIGVRVVGAHSYFLGAGTVPEWLSFGAFRTNRGTSATPPTTLFVNSSLPSTRYTQRLTTQAY